MPEACRNSPADQGMLRAGLIPVGEVVPMRRWVELKRLLALVVTVVFVLVSLAVPAFAAKGFSGSKSGGFSSGSRSFSAPKASTPSPSRSFSAPKPSTGSSSSSGSSRSFSSPAPAPSTSTDSKGYTTPSSPSYSSGSRSYSGESRSYSSERSSASNPSSSSTAAPKTPPPNYDTGRTSYPSRPPVVIIGPSTYDPGYWHDWYWGRPWWWRMWHRPVYYGGSSWGISWVSVVGGLVVAWVGFSILSAYISRRRR